MHFTLSIARCNAGASPTTVRWPRRWRGWRAIASSSPRSRTISTGCSSSRAAALKRAAPGAAQYVVSKLHLIEAHRLSTGAEVRVAVIDSKIDTRHPDLAGAIVAQDDVIGAAGPPHAHGTAMAGAIAAHSQLLGVAPKVRILAVRAFSGTADSAQGTTFNILKGLDWAAQRARAHRQYELRRSGRCADARHGGQGACARHGAHRRGRQCRPALAAALSGGLPRK